MNIKEQAKIFLGAQHVGMIRHFYQYLTGYKKHLAELQQQQDRKCYLIGTANYANLGDLAISEAQISFLRCHFKGQVVEIQTSHFWEYAKGIQKLIRPEDIICLQGGGNMGDLYNRFEFERCAVMSLFPHNRCIVMPQTMSYSSSGSDLLAYTQKVYSRQKNLFLFAREHMSKEAMQKTYKNAEISLVPDIVFYLDAKDFVDIGSERNGITKVLRNDDERSLSEHDWAIIDDAVKKFSMPSKKLDTVLVDNQEVSRNQRKEYLRDILNSFKSSSAVVTDRLHGMIFAYITHTPCVVLANNNHKIAGVYNWIKDCGFVKFVEATDQVEDALKIVLNGNTDYSRNITLEQFAPLINAFSNVNLKL
jgi:pyruvyl transferase EpsI